MDNITREVLKIKIKGLTGTAFQEAIDRIYFNIYGEEGFQRVKQKKDGGSDGIVNGQMVLAVYAPEKYTLSNFKKKIEEDYQSYTSNWESTYNKWAVVTNLEATAKMIQFVKNLKYNSNIICIETLLQKIDSQTWTVKNAIFRALDIPEIYLNNDLIFTLIEDLIQISSENNSFEPYQKPAYIKDKIELNASEDNVAVLMDEYEEYLAVFPIISNVIKSRSKESIKAIRSKIRSTYMSSSGSFEKKLNEIVSIMSQSKANDDYYILNMRIVMIYFFEQCLFGKKPESEVVE